MLPELADYDWEYAFAFASGDGSSRRNAAPEPAPGAKVSTKPFDREDVAEIAALSKGENDGNEWLICGTLTDGRVFFLAAGCDYTGWDCQCWGRSYVGTNWQDLCLVIPPDDAIRLRESNESRSFSGLNFAYGTPFVPEWRWFPPTRSAA